MEENYLLFNGHAPTSRTKLVEFICPLVDVGETTMIEMINTKFCPFSTLNDENYKPSVRRLCLFLGVSPEDVYGLPPFTGRDALRQSLPSAPLMFEHIDHVRHILMTVGSSDSQYVQVLKGRYGINSDQMTLQQLADQFDVTRQRIKQIENDALSFSRMVAVRFQTKRVARKELSTAELQKRMANGAEQLKEMGISLD